MSDSFQGIPFSSKRLSSCPIIPWWNCMVPLSMGNIPEASPTPSTFLPVSFQWMYPAKVVR